MALLSRFTTAFGALRHRLFRRVWIAQFLSQTGNWLQITGRAVLIYEVTGSTTALGTIYFLSYSPQLVLSPLAGVLADRFDRRRVLITGQCVAMCGALAMGALAATDTATLTTVGAVSVLIGLVQTAMMPATQALLPSLVPKSSLTEAVSLTAATSAATRVFGPMLASGLIPLVGLPWLFWGNAITFAVIITVWTFTKVPGQARMTETRTFAAVAAGFRLVRANPALRVAVATTVVVAGIGNMYQPLGVAYAVDVLAGGDADLGARYYGFLQAALGAGAFCGILGITDIAKRRPARGILFSSAGVSVLLIGLGLSGDVVAVLPVAVLLGAFHFATNTLSINVLQHLTPDEMRGRIMAIHSLAFVGTLPLVSLSGGALASVIGVQATLVGVGVLCALYCIPLVRWSRYLPDAELVGDPREEAELERIASLEEDGQLPILGDGDPTVGSPPARAETGRGWSPSAGDTGWRDR